MIEIVKYISLILWVGYFFLGIYREIKRNKNKNIKEILQKPFHFIRIDSLFFLIVYLYYNKIARDEVLPYLYLIIVITNIVYLLYDLFDNYKFERINKNDLLYYFLGIIIVVLLTIYLFICDNAIRVSTITLVINILIPCFISVVSFFKKN